MFSSSLKTIPKTLTTKLNCQRNINAIPMPSKYIKEVWGRVHSIDSFTAIDGDGIRYMLFLQGCNLKCKSCSNPDTWSYHNEIKNMSSKEVIKNVYKYQNYVEGITISGGEPLLQPEFVSNIFQECHELGLNTCIDTAGQSLPKNWDMILPHTDLVLFCLKHIDPLKYYKFTGMPQIVAMKFLETMETMAIPYYMRYLYIPGYSDDYKDIDKFIDLAKSMKSMKAIEFLPYHRLGVDKWKNMGMNYELESVPIPSKKNIDEIKNYMINSGLKVF